MANRLTQKQKGFVATYLDTGNATEAALQNYDTEDRLTAASIGSENLTKPNILAYIESKAEKAAEIIFSLAQHGESDAIRLNASKDILDRAGYKPVEKSMNVNVEIKPEPSDKIKGLADKLNQ